MKLQLLVLVVSFFVSSGDSYTEADVEYYEQLIQSEIRRASTYQQPQDAKEFQHTNLEPVDYGTVDFGAGSAGSVAAAKLSEISRWQILLLEAGQEETNFTKIPAMFSYATRLEYSWGFQTAPQNTCSLSTGGTFKYSRGKSLGGSSAINNLVYIRGNKLDYDKWESEGNPGWSYNDVLPYFIKSEHAMFSGQEGYHGYEGPLSVEYHRPSSRKLNIFLQANKDIDAPTVDYNGKEQLGASKVQQNTFRGSRMSSARAFLQPARSRSNLKISTNSYVTKILISNQTKRAHGVLFSHNNIQYVVKVRKEIVLCAGVINSPHLLMLSGIGPSEHLNQFNISVTKNLAVGKDMHDHLLLRQVFVYTPVAEQAYSLRDAIKQYLSGTGPLTAAGNVEGIGFYQAELEKVPFVDIVTGPSISPEEFNSLKNQNVSLESSATENNIFRFYIFLLHPKTTGSIYLKSSDPYEFPLINSRCLADPKNQDIKSVLKAFDIISKLLSTKPFKKLLPTLLPYPPCLVHRFLTPEYFTCFVRQTASNALHGTSTCKMGPDPSKGAVVGQDFKVYGIKNLRVADASVIPSTLSGQISAPCMMVGERVADFIKFEYYAN